jgi:hypothetical protein
MFILDEVSFASRKDLEKCYQIHWRLDNGERVQAHKEEITRDVPSGWTEGLVDNPKIVDVI